jgi:hypothetical protein
LVKLISVEKRRDSAFLGALVAVYILSRLQLHLPFECIYFFKKENEYQRFLFGSSFGFKASCLNLAIALAMLWLFLSQ